MYHVYNKIEVVNLLHILEFVTSASFLYWNMGMWNYIYMQGWLQLIILHIKLMKCKIKERFLQYYAPRPGAVGSGVTQAVAAGPIYVFK